MMYQTLKIYHIALRIVERRSEQGSESEEMYLEVLILGKPGI